MPKHFLSICAIIRNESAYLPEWLAFHRLQGVERFYIYLNSNIGEDPETKEVIYRELDGGDIDIRLWPGTKQQCTAYNDCLQVFGDESEWIAFIDCDEFLWSPNFIWRADTPYPVNFTIKEVLDSFSSHDIGAIAVHWMLFGSNGHTEKTDGLIIERFTRRAATPNKHVKSIVRPSAVASAGKNPHAFYLRDSYVAISEQGSKLPVEYALMEGGSANILRINHYHTKSLAEYFSRKRNPDPNSGRAYTEEFAREKFNAHDVNEVEDTILRDLYAEKIKEKING